MRSAAVAMTAAEMVRDFIILAGRDMKKGMSCQERRRDSPGEAKGADQLQLGVVVLLLWTITPAV